MIACLYDIHGNLPALEAVLEDARAQGATRYVLGGDYALFGGWPVETVERLAGLEDVVRIRGNGERWTAHPDEAPDDPTVQGAIAACREALGSDLVIRLAALQERVHLDGAVVVHGSPLSDVRSFMPEPTADEEELLAGTQAARVVFGHTHLPFIRTRPDGMELLNPGSVGMPFDGDPRAAYALIGDDDRVEHRRVAYEHAASAARVVEAFGDDAWTRTVAARIRAARFDA